MSRLLASNILLEARKMLAVYTTCRYIPYSGYFTWGLNFVVFVVGKQNTKISDTKIKCTV